MSKLCLRIAVLSSVCLLARCQDVNIREPPHNTTLLSGANMTQLCSPDVSYTGFFEWRFYASATDMNGHQIYNYPPYKSNLQYPSNKYQQVNTYGLAIYSMLVADGGLYSCSFLTGDTKAYATVVVVDEPRAVITPAEAVQGANVTLSCSVVFGGPANGSSYLPQQFPQLAMLFNGQQVIDTVHSYVPSIDHSRPHTLTCVARMVVSASDSGRKLECRVTTQTPVFDVTTSATLNVRVPAYNLQIVPFSSQYVVNDVIKCSAEGYPAPRVQWIAVSTPSSVTTVDGQNLNVSSAMLGNNVWECTAANQLNTAKLSQQITFNVVDRAAVSSASNSNAMIGLGVGLAIGISLLLTGAILLVAFLVKRRNRNRAEKTSLGPSESAQPFIYTPSNAANPEADYRPPGGGQPVPKPRIASTSSTLEPATPSADQSIDKPRPLDRSNTPQSANTSVDKPRSGRKPRPTYPGSRESLDRSIDGVARPVPAQRPPTSIRASQDSLNRSLDSDAAPRPSQRQRAAFTGSNESIDKPQAKPRPIPATRASNESLDRSVDSDSRPRPSHRAKVNDTNTSFDSGVTDQSSASARGKPRPALPPGVAPKPVKQRGQPAQLSDQSNSTDV